MTDYNGKAVPQQSCSDQSSYDDLCARLEERGGRIPTAAAQAIRELEARLEATKGKAEETILDLMSKLRAAERKLDEESIITISALGQAHDAYEAQLEAEAKLAKAVEALELAVIRWDEHQKYGIGMSGDWVDDARTTLAEIEGEKG